MRERKRREPWTEKEVIAKIQEWVRLYGDTPTETDWNPSHARHCRRAQVRRLMAWDHRIRRFESGDWPWGDSVKRHFGGWNAAIEAAGFKGRKLGRQRRVTMPLQATHDDLLRAWDAVCDSLDDDEQRFNLNELACIALALAEQE